VHLLIEICQPQLHEQHYRSLVITPASALTGFGLNCSITALDQVAGLTNYSNLQRLFDSFFSTKETGTGLGLTIAARIVEKHGGVLQYQTRAGHGTTFGVVLPREINHTA